MRRLLIITLLVWASSAWALPAFIINKSCGGNNGCTTAAVDTSGCNFLIMTVTQASGTPATPTDSKSNTWVALTEHVSSTTHQKAFYSTTGLCGTGHTFTDGTTSQTVGLTVMAFSGVSGAGQPDQQNGAAGVGTTRATGSITPTKDKELVVTYSGSDAATSFTETVNGGFSTAVGIVGSGTQRSSWMAYQIKDPAGALNPTWTDSNASNMAVGIASFFQSTGNCAACDMSGKLEKPVLR